MGRWQKSGRLQQLRSPQKYRWAPLPPPSPGAVAAQQEAEKARRQQALADARYRRVMDTAAIGMCLLAEDGTFLEVNPALCKILGYDADTLTQKRWHDRSHIACSAL